MNNQTKPTNPVHDTSTGTMDTVNGIRVDLRSPKPETITLDDIARGLSNEARFCGQMIEHYSVAQHTLLVWHLAPDHLKAVALIHDAAEAYLKDIHKPLKNLLAPLYKPLEAAFEKVIFHKYHVELSALKELKPYDNQATEIESDYFRRGKLNFISIFYDINEKLPFKTPYEQLRMLLLSEFSQYEFDF